MDKCTSFDVFLSYERNDQDSTKVRKLRIALHRLGLTVWFDEEMSNAQAFEKDCELCSEGISQSSGALFLVTRAYHDNLSTLAAKRGDVCSFQLDKIMLGKRSTEMVVVLLDEQVLGVAAWAGRMAQLKHREIVDLSDLDNFITTKELDTVIRKRLLSRMKWIGGIAGGAGRISEPSLAGRRATLAHPTRSSEPGSLDIYGLANRSLPTPASSYPTSTAAPSRADPRSVEAHPARSSGPGSSALHGLAYRSFPTLSSSYSTTTTPRQPQKRDETKPLQGPVTLRSIRAGRRSVAALGMGEKHLAEYQLESFTLDSIRAAMAAKLREPVFQVAACNVISQLTSECKTSRSDAIKLSVLETIESTMSVNEESPSVQEAACLAIQSLTFNDIDNKLQAGRLGLLSRIKTALDKHISSDKVQEQACLALQKLTCNCPENRSLAVQLGLLKSLRCTMSTHLISAPVQFAACMAIQNIMPGDHARDAAEALHLSEHVKRTLDVHLCEPSLNLISKILLDELTSRKVSS